MSTIRNVSSATNGALAPGAGPSASPPPASGAVDLLPSCEGPDAAQLGDAMAALYALELAGQSSDEASGRAQVESQQQRVHQALRDQLQALQRQQHDSGGKGFFSCVGKLLADIAVDLSEFHFGSLVADVRSDCAACDNPRFWSDLELGAKVVAAIAAAAATVCSCGTLGPVVVGVAIALSAAGFAVQQTHCLGSASTWVGLGCQLAASVVTCGASFAAAGAASASLFETAGGAATATAGAATVVAGAAHVEATGFQADALQAQADRVRAQRDAELARQVGQWAVDTLQEQVDSHREAMTALGAAMQINQQASLVAAAPLARG